MAAPVVRCLLGVVDVLPAFAYDADLKGDLLDLMQRFPRDNRRVQPIECCRSSWPPGLEFAGGNLDAAHLWPGAQALACLHLQHRREMLLGRFYVAGHVEKARSLLCTF